MRLSHTSLLAFAFLVAGVSLSALGTVRSVYTLIAPTVGVLYWADAPLCILLQAIDPRLVPADAIYKAPSQAAVVVDKVATP